MVPQKPMPVLPGELPVPRGAPEAPFAQQHALTVARCHQLLIEWNDTDRDIIPATFSDLFEAQTTRTPDAPALLAPSTSQTELSLSYADLDARANRLAHFLISAGAGPEQVVLRGRWSGILRCGGRQPLFGRGRVRHALHVEVRSPILLR